jgi:hypothetical protein
VKVKYVQVVKENRNGMMMMMRMRMRMRMRMKRMKQRKESICLDKKIYTTGVSNARHALRTGPFVKATVLKVSRASTLHSAGSNIFNVGNKAVDFFRLAASNASNVGMI